MKKYWQERKRIIYLVSPALIGAIFLIMCFANFGQSVNYSESYNIHLTRNDFAGVWNTSIADATPPLYAFTLKTWAHFSGHSVVTMRALSAIFGAIAVVFAFLFLKYKYGSTVAIVSTFMLAISPILVRSGQEIGPATMLLAIVFAATFFLQLALDSGKKYWWAIYVLLIIAGMLTSHSAVFAWLAHLVYLATIYKKDLTKQKFIYIYLLPIALYLPWMFAPARGVSSGLAMNNFTDFFSLSLLYDQASGVTNWLLLPYIADMAIILILAIRYSNKAHLVSSFVAVPIASVVILSALPFQISLAPQTLIYSAVSINVLAGITLVLYAREKFAKKRKKNQKFFDRHPEIRIAFATIILVGVPIMGLISVYEKGNYNFETGKKTTVSELYENIVALDHFENLSIITPSRELYYELSVYETYHHDVHYLENINMDEFLKDRDAVWYVDISPESGSLDSPREDMRATTIAKMQFDDAADAVQILKLEKE